MADVFGGFQFRRVSDEELEAIRAVGERHVAVDKAKGEDQGIEVEFYVYNGHMYVTDIRESKQ